MPVISSSFPVQNSCAAQDFQEFLHSSLGVKSTSPLYAPLVYSLQGGKRTRASLVLALCDYYGIPDRSALPLAAAVEMVHAFSLIQDDLPCMDNDHQRRNKPSLHIRFDEGTALLTANCLFAKAFELVASAARETGLPDYAAQCITELSAVTGAQGMSLGQWYDLNYDFAEKDALLKSYSLKSGVLFAVCLTLPSILAGVNPERVEKLKDIGCRIGSIYQIKDDLEDYADRPAIGTERDISILHLLERAEANALQEKMTAALFDDLKQLDGIGDIIARSISSIVGH